MTDPLIPRIERLLDRLREERFSGRVLVELTLREGGLRRVDIFEAKPTQVLPGSDQH